LPDRKKNDKIGEFTVWLVRSVAGLAITIRESRGFVAGLLRGLDFRQDADRFHKGTRIMWFYVGLLIVLLLCLSTLRWQFSRGSRWTRL